MLYEVVVIPDNAIHIELLWHTPEDLDETDMGPEAGADLDLHFTHQSASGPDLDKDGNPDPWFDMPFDCFWFSAHPNWGLYDPAVDDDPTLVLDDTDGAGPEILTLNNPENIKYKVGVHYWNDHKFGGSYATVKAYVWSQQVIAVKNVLLNDLDMWEVLSITWPDEIIELVIDDYGNYKITPLYENPYFFN